MSWLVAPRAPCKTCGKPYDVRADGKLRAHRIETPFGQKRCSGGHVPADDYYPLVTDVDLRAIAEQRLDHAADVTFELGEPVTEGWSRCGGCGGPSTGCPCYLASPEG